MLKELTVKEVETILVKIIMCMVYIVLEIICIKYQI